MAALKNRKPIYIKIFRYFLIVLGCFILAFGSGVFLAPSEIVSGGVTGIAIIINYYIEPLIHFNVLDITVFVLNVIFFILGVIFLGKKFSMNTLLASLIYPLFLALFTRVPFFISLGQQFLATQWAGSGTILAAIFGGMSVGAGCALTFLGGGSTGGVDILTFILDKFLGLKQSIGILIVDGSVILTSLFTVMEGDIVRVAIGILSSMLTAFMIQLIYVESDSAYIADIISDKHEEICKYIREQMDRTTTLIDVTGTYHQSKKVMIRFVLDKREYIVLKDAIAKIDPKAFITIASASTVLGEGFKSLKSSIYSKPKKREKIENNKEIQ